MIRKAIIVVLTWVALMIGMLQTLSFFWRLDCGRTRSIADQWGFTMTDGAVMVSFYRYGRDCAEPPMMRRSGINAGGRVGFTGLHDDTRLAGFRYTHAHWLIELPRLPLVGERNIIGCQQWVDIPAWAFAVLMLLFALYPMVVLVHAVVREHWRAKGFCVVCRYDLTGNVSGTCPECGAKVQTP